jgi:hypoxanthine-DNA glycosylase
MGFEPIADDKCQVLILGTMPSIESIKINEYYGNKRNAFWKIIFSLYGMEVREDYKEKIDFLLSNHIAVWDVLESCERDGSSDISIRNSKANDFNKFFIQYPNIKKVYFNGKTAEKLYLKLVGKEISDGIIHQVCLPSTSPANAIKFEEKIKEWRGIVSSLNGIIDSNIIKVLGQVGGYTGSSYEVSIDFLTLEVDYKYMEYGYIPTTEKRIALSEDSLIKFAKSLYKNDVFNWEPTYEPEYPICDGTSWSVSIITKEYNKLSEGNNEYPTQWDGFCRSIKSLVGEEFS